MRDLNQERLNVGIRFIICINMVSKSLASSKSFYIGAIFFLDKTLLLRY